MSTQEQEIQEAIESVRLGQFRSIRQSAVANLLPRSTIGHRRAGRLPRSSITPKSARLTAIQKNILIQYIQDLQLQYQPPNHHQIRFIAQQLANQNGPSKELGKNWVSRFIQGCTELQTGQTNPLPIERITAPDAIHVERWFAYLFSALDRYKISTQNIYNIDKMGF